MKSTNTAYIAILSLAFVSLFAFPVCGFAQTAGLSIEKHVDAPVENRFVIGPAKIESEVSAGDTKTVFVDLENRTGRTESFEISFEDFTASKDQGAVVELLGNSVSDTSLKNALYVPQKNIVLAHGDRVRIPVTISIGAGTIPGGKFASVVVSAKVSSAVTTESGAQAGAVVVGRLATLVFVTVPGNIAHDATTDAFVIAKHGSVFFGTPVTLNVTFSNRGATYENPYGGITVRNIFGNDVSKTAIDPWYVLPGSTRNRDVVISTKGLFGFYTATLEINRGYGDIVDTKNVSFFAVSPVTLILLVVVIMFVFVLAYKKFVKRA